MNRILPLIGIILSFALYAQTGTVVTVQGPLTDICTAISKSIALLPAAGGTIDARALGSSTTAAACGSNPFAANNASGSPKPIHLLLGLGTIQTTAQWLIQTSNVYIEGAGAALTHIQYTGSAALYDPVGSPNPGGIIEFVANHTAEGSYPNGEISNIGLTGVGVYGTSTYPTAAPYALFVDGVIHSSFSENSVWAVAADGYHEIFGVLNHWVHNRCSLNEIGVIGAPSVTPQNCLNLAGYSTNFQAAKDTIINPIAEGLSNCGIISNFALQPTIIGGSSEQNHCGLQMGSSSSGTNGTILAVVDGIDTEANNTSGDIIDYGFKDTYLGILSESAVGSRWHGYETLITGSSELNSPTVEPGAHNVIFAPGTFFLNNPPADNSSDRSTFTNDTFTGGNQSENSPFPWSWCENSRLVSNGIRVTANRANLCEGQYTFGSTETGLSKISSSTFTAGSPWHVAFFGEWTNNSSSGAQAPFMVELSNSNPSYTYGALTVTFGLDSSGQLYGVTTGSGAVAFKGTVITDVADSSASGTAAIYTHDSASFGPVTAASFTTQSGAPVMIYVGTITTTASTKDQTTFSGVPSGSYCFVQPANSTAAGMSQIYVPATSGARPNNFSIYHSATGASGGVFSVYCP
jgi:hypothetical protein